MAANDDELAQIAADDALLADIAADQGVGDDAAGALLADIVHTVDGLAPSDTPGGSGRRGRGRGRGRRGGLWGVTLGVSIAVAASGGLSAAATDRLPEPVRRLAVEVGQAAPPADASQVAVTPTTLPSPSLVEPVQESDGSDPYGDGGYGGYGAQAERSPVGSGRGAAAFWWQIASTPRMRTHDANEPAGGATPPLRDGRAASPARTSSWGLPRTMTDPTRTSDAAHSSGSYPGQTPTETAAPAPSRSTSAAPSASPRQTQSPAPAPARTASQSPTPAPTHSMVPTVTTTPRQRTGHGAPAHARPASPHAATPTRTDSHGRH